MATSRSKSEVQILENYRVALTNALSQPEVLASLSEIGYGPEELAKGNALLSKTTQVFDLNKQEDNETNAARLKYDQLKGQVRKEYMRDRQKAKVVFRKDEVALNQLDLIGSVPRTYAKLIETMTTFYSNLEENAELLGRMSRLNVSQEDIKAALTSILNLEAARADYLKEIGESQDATKAKDLAFDKLNDWMIDFIAVAKIAMDEQPQLLESLGIFVRS